MVFEIVCLLVQKVFEKHIILRGTQIPKLDGLLLPKTISVGFELLLGSIFRQRLTREKLGAQNTGKEKGKLVC